MQQLHIKLEVDSPLIQWVNAQADSIGARGHIGTHLDCYTTVPEKEEYQIKGIVIDCTAGMPSMDSMAHIGSLKNKALILHTGNLEHNRYGTEEYFNKDTTLCKVSLHTILSKKPLFIIIDSHGIAEKGKRHIEFDKICEANGCHVIENVDLSCIGNQKEVPLKILININHKSTGKPCELYSILESCFDNTSSHEDSLKAWEANADFWDESMGENSNEFQRLTVRPIVNELLKATQGDYILDIACGNGNYSGYLAEQGIDVLAFDYSQRMVELARKRQARFNDRIEFCVADVTKYEDMMSLKRNKPFTKAVSNMAIMDISDIDNLFRCVNKLLAENGYFEFSTQHPCFVTLTNKYMTKHNYYGEAIEGQPQKQCYYHRSLQDIFEICFRHGFIIDGFYEACFGNDRERPVVIIIRAKKHNL